MAQRWKRSEPEPQTKEALHNVGFARATTSAQYPN